MALPSSGMISLAQLQTEFGGANPISLSEYYRGAGYTTANNTNVPASGAIALSQFFSAIKVTPGSVAYTTPGTYTLTVPAYSALSIDVRGASGGGGGGSGIDQAWSVFASGSAGQAGSQSYFLASGIVQVVGYGGGGGGPGNFYYNSPIEQYVSVTGTAGAHGTGANGDSNITAGGPAGGAAGVVDSGFPPTSTNYGGAGGYGGRATRTFAPNVIPTASTVTIVVGSAGPAGANSKDPYSVYGYPQAGANGAVYISWS